MCLTTDDHPKASSVQELLVQIYVSCGTAQKTSQGHVLFVLVRVQGSLHKFCSRVSQCVLSHSLLSWYTKVQDVF